MIFCSTAHWPIQVEHFYQLLWKIFWFEAFSQVLILLIDDQLLIRVILLNRMAKLSSEFVLQYLRCLLLLERVVWLFLIFRSCQMLFSLILKLQFYQKVLISSFISQVWLLFHLSFDRILFKNLLLKMFLKCWLTFNVHFHQILHVHFMIFPSLVVWYTHILLPLIMQHSV